MKKNRERYTKSTRKIYYIYLSEYIIHRVIQELCYKDFIVCINIYNRVKCMLLKFLYLVEHQLLVNFIFFLNIFEEWFFGYILKKNVGSYLVFKN